MTAQGSTAWRRFGLVFAAVFLPCGSGTLVLGRMPDAVRCRPTATSDTFLAECRGIGDYEHAAYAFALEPRAVVALGAAQVVMLGNSRVQFAFSSDARGTGFPSAACPPTGSASATTRVRPSRSSRCAGPGRLRAWRSSTRTSSSPTGSRCPRPGSATSPGGPGLPPCAAAWRLTCAPPSVRGSRSGSPAAGSTARSTALAATAPGLGRTASVRRRARPTSTRAPESGERSRGRSPNGGAFLAASGLDPGCLVLTSVPNSLVEAREATAGLARELGARATLPRVAGLHTLDGSHLDAASAEAWSRAFLDEFEPVLRACLGG